MVIFNIIFILYKYKTYSTVSQVLKNIENVETWKRGNVEIKNKQKIKQNIYGRKDHSPYHEARGYQGQTTEVPRY